MEHNELESPTLVSVSERPTALSGRVRCHPNVPTLRSASLSLMQRYLEPTGRRSLFVTPTERSGNMEFLPFGSLWTKFLRLGFVPRILHVPQFPGELMFICSRTSPHRCSRPVLERFRWRSEQSPLDRFASHRQSRVNRTSSPNGDVQLPNRIRARSPTERAAHQESQRLHLELTERRRTF